MKCNLSSKRILGGMLVVGAILAVCGAAAGMLFDEAQHMQARAAGMVCGMGTALALMGKSSYLAAVKLLCSEVCCAMALRQT